MSAHGGADGSRHCGDDDALSSKRKATATAVGPVTAWALDKLTLATLGKILPGLIIYSDELNHASMIEGVKGARCEKHVPTRPCMFTTRQAIYSHHPPDHEYSRPARPCILATRRYGS